MWLPIESVVCLHGAGWLLATDVTQPYTDPAVTLVHCPIVNPTDVTQPYTDPAVTLVYFPIVNPTDVTQPYTDPAVTLVHCPIVNPTDVTQPYTDPAVTPVLCPTVHARTIQMQSQRSFPKPYVKYFPDDGRTGLIHFGNNIVNRQGNLWHSCGAQKWCLSMSAVSLCQATSVMSERKLSVCLYMPLLYPR